jgi:hypothetical protein
MTFRDAARVAKCSHGSIHLEKKLMKAEELAAKKKLEEELRTKLSGQSPELQVLDESVPWN